MQITQYAKQASADVVSALVRYALAKVANMQGTRQVISVGRFTFDSHVTPEMQVVHIYACGKSIARVTII